jgi:hypothetical protein
MNCSRAKHLIFLSRNGERTVLESEQLTEHLRGCSRCRTAAEHASAIQEITSLARQEQIDLPDAPQLTLDILDALPPPQVWWFDNAIRRIAPVWIQRTRACAFALLAAGCIGLLGESLQDALKMSSLEDRLQSSSLPSTSALVWNVPALLDHLSPSQRDTLLRFVRSRTGFGTLRSGQFAPVDQLLRSHTNGDVMSLIDSVRSELSPETRVPHRSTKTVKESQ